MSKSTPNNANMVSEWLILHPGIFSTFMARLATWASNLHAVLRRIAQESLIANVKPDAWQRYFTDIPNWRGLLAQFITNYIATGVADIATSNGEGEDFDYAATMNKPDYSTANFHADAMKVIRENPPSLDIFTAYSSVHENLAAPKKENHDNEVIPEGLITKKIPLEILFLVEIAIPCYLFHGETVEDLLAKVKNKRDFQAARKLVELDRAFLLNPDMMTLYRNLKDKNLAEQLTQAANNSKAYEKLTLQKVKYLLLALMLEVQEQFAVLTAPMLALQQQAIAQASARIHEVETLLEKAAVADKINSCRAIFPLLAAPFVPLSALRDLFDLIARSQTGECDPDLPPTMKGLESGVTRARGIFSQVKLFANLSFLHRK